MSDRTPLKLKFSEGAYTAKVLDTVDGEMYSVLSNGSLLDKDGKMVGKIDKEMSYREIELTMLKALAETSVATSKSVSDVVSAGVLLRELEKLPDDATEIEIIERDKKALAAAVEVTAGKRPVDWARYAFRMLEQLV